MGGRGEQAAAPDGAGIVTAVLAHVICVTVLFIVLFIRATSGQRALHAPPGCVVAYGMGTPRGERARPCLVATHIRL